MNSVIPFGHELPAVVRPNGDTKFEGVTPDILVEDNIFTDKDEILDYTIDIIKKNDKK